MPRKQNGFGNFQSRSVKGLNKSLKSGKVGAAGSYPGNRQFGSSITRTVIEQYDLDSNWVRWRKGLEYYYNGASYTIYKTDANGDVVLDSNGNKEEAFLDSKLYQGTSYEIDIEFTGSRYPTANSDSNNHYVVKRTNKSSSNIGTVSAIYNDSSKTYTPSTNLSISGASNFSHQEIWVKLTNTSDLILRTVGERITDTQTEATLKNILNDQLHPAIYFGKTKDTNKATIKVTVPLNAVLATSFIQDNNNDVQALLGQIGSLGAYAQEVSITSETFRDENFEFFVTESVTKANQTFQILNNTTDFSPTVLDIAGMSKIYETTVADIDFDAEYYFVKGYYQRFFGDKYLTAQVVEQECNKLSYSIPPFTIKSVLVVGAALEISAVPFEADMQLYSSASTMYAIFTDFSFTNKVLDTYNGTDYHTPGNPSDPNPWYRLETDVDPWYDEIFTSGQNLTIGNVYCCSCPNFANSIIRMPESTSDDGKKINNRQYRYPLPTAMSKVDFENVGMSQAAGVVQSWESFKQRTGLKLCKHTIASMFGERLKLKEPSEYPSLQARETFEAKLEKDMASISSKASAGYKRSGITNMELVYTLAEGLNLDEVETAAVILGTKF